MKLKIIIFSVFLFFFAFNLNLTNNPSNLFCGIAQAKEEKPILEFNGEKYYLRYANIMGTEENPAGLLNEFTRKNEKINNYTKMMGLYLFDGLDVNKYFANFKKDKTKFTLHSFEKKNVKMISFLMSPPDKSFIEYNVFKFIGFKGNIYGIQYVQKYKVTPEQSGNKALLKELLAQIEQDNAKYLNEMNTKTMPQMYFKKYGKQ